MSGTPLPAMAARPALPSAAPVALVEVMLAETREEISRADNKAATLLAACGIGAGALLAGFIAGTWSPNDLHNEIEWLWWIGLASAAFAVLRLGLCITPIVANKQSSTRVDYYGDVNGYPTAEALAEALAGAPGDLYQRNVRQLHVTALIVRNKYSHLRWSMTCLLVGVAATAFSVLVDLMVS